MEPNDDVEISIDANDEISESIVPQSNRTPRQVQQCTFSHWSRPGSFISRLILAGFYGCNIDDRVICISCDIICQNWNPDIDDPCEVHRINSPDCPYVRKNLMNIGPQAASTDTYLSPTVNVTATSTRNSSSVTDIVHQEIVRKSSHNPRYQGITTRESSFANWPNQNSPSVDAFARAGFYYTGANGIVTCFYCNGSLQNWGPNDNPMTEHARWFPHCGYVQQLCGNALFRRIQESRRQQEQSRIQAQIETNAQNISDAQLLTINRRLGIRNDDLLDRLVAARLDLPVSQRLRNMNFSPAIIKRCWVDQLRIKEQDFISESDLHMACIILQKQIEHINGDREKIIIPSRIMREIRQLNEIRSQVALVERLALINVDASPSLNGLGSQPAIQVAAASSSEPINHSILHQRPNSMDTDDPTTSLTASNACMICFTEERHLACLPCGHFVACVPCGHSLNTCPICRSNIENFVRIYM